jgi:hypothetical protein
MNYQHTKGSKEKDLIQVINQVFWWKGILCSKEIVYASAGVVNTLTNVRSRVFSLEADRSICKCW